MAAPSTPPLDPVDTENVEEESALAPPSFPPYPPYAVEPAPPSVADTIMAGRDIRYYHKSAGPKKPVRPAPRPAKPRGPKATDVKLSKRAMRAHARCLRRHNAVLTDRLEQMSKPDRRRIICLWRDHGHILPAETIARLRTIMDADEPFKPDQAYQYFINLRKSKKKSTALCVKEVKKDLVAMCAEKRFTWARNATVAFARGIQQRFSRPGRYALADGMLRLSNIIMNEICGYVHMKPPSRRSTHPKSKFMFEMSDKVAVWFDEILSESDDRMLMMDYDEDDDVVRADGTGDRFADDFLDMMGGADGRARGPPAYERFTGDMAGAFGVLIDEMYKNGNAQLVEHGKFKQSYKEAADELKRAEDFSVVPTNTLLAQQLNNKLSNTVDPVTPPKLASAMKTIVELGANYLAQNAEFNKIGAAGGFGGSGGVAGAGGGRTGAGGGGMGAGGEVAVAGSSGTDVGGVTGAGGGGKGGGVAGVGGGVAGAGGSGTGAGGVTGAGGGGTSASGGGTGAGGGGTSASGVAGAGGGGTGAGGGGSGAGGGVGGAGSVASTGMGGIGAGGVAGAGGGVVGAGGGAAGAGGGVAGAGGSAAGAGGGIAGMGGGVGEPGGGVSGPDGGVAGASGGVAGRGGGLAGADGGVAGAGGGVSGAGGVTGQGLNINAQGAASGLAGKGYGADDFGLDKSRLKPGEGYADSQRKDGKPGAIAGSGVEKGFYIDENGVKRKIPQDGADDFYQGLDGGRRGGRRGSEEQDPDRASALEILHKELCARNNAVFYKQPQSELSYKQASKWLKMKPRMKVDKAVKESGDTARLSNKFERKLDDLVVKKTPPNLKDAMQDVIIENSRILAENFISSNYKALARDGLISEMQKKGNEILAEIGDASETYFFAAQRLKKAKNLDANDPCDRIASYLAKQLDELMRCRSMARKVISTLKEHIKDASLYLSEHVTKPDKQIEAYVALLGEMESAGDALLFEGDIPKSYKSCAAYLRNLTSFEDQINLSNVFLKSSTKSKLKSLMSNVLEVQRYPAIDQVIDDCAGLLVSYIMLQGEKTKALQVLIDKMTDAGPDVLLRHGTIRKTFSDGANVLREKNADQLNVTSADPVVARKVQLKLTSLMQERISDKYQALMNDVIEDATMYLANYLLQPKIIRVCECMKNVFVQCELRSDEMLRRAVRPRCQCSRYVSAQALDELAPATPGPYVLYSSTDRQHSHPSSSSPPAFTANPSYVAMYMTSYKRWRVQSPPSNSYDSEATRSSLSTECERPGRDPPSDSYDSVTSSTIPCKPSYPVTSSFPCRPLFPVTSSYSRSPPPHPVSPSFPRRPICPVNSSFPPSTICPVKSSFPPSTICPVKSSFPPSTICPVKSSFPLSTICPVKSSFPPSTICPVKLSFPPSTICPVKSSSPPSTKCPVNSSLPRSPTFPRTASVPRSPSFPRSPSLPRKPHFSRRTCYPRRSSIFPLPCSPRPQSPPILPRPSSPRDSVFPSCPSAGTRAITQNPMKSVFVTRTPIVSTDQMSDWHAMMVSLMWNVQAWRDWIQENIDRAIFYQPDPNLTRAEANESWRNYQRKIATEALQWRQYNIFSRQLTLRLGSRYRDKYIVSPTRTKNRTEAYTDCQKEMLEIIDMFSRWTQWLSTIIKESNSFPDSGTDVSSHELCWNNFKMKVEEYSEHWNKYNSYLKVCFEQKYRTLIAEWLPPWKSPGPVWIVSVCGAVPSGAVCAGLYDSELVWVARTTHKCNVLPGALHPAKHCCVVFADKAIHHYTKYQVMCNANAAWLPWRAGRAAARAVRVAPAVCAGRVLYRGSHLLGAVRAPHYRCHVVIFGRPFAFNCYELLVLPEE